MPRLVHFEQAYDDPEAAGKFYADVFGWKVDRWDDGEDPFKPYWMVTTGPEGEPGINGGFLKKADWMPQAINTLEVANIEEAIAKVEAAGGSVVKPKMDIGGMAWQAYCKDPGGVVFGLHEPIKPA